MYPLPLPSPTRHRHRTGKDCLNALIRVGRFQHCRIELHAQGKPQPRQFLFNLVERFLPEIPVLEHFLFGLHGQLADGRDVGVVQTVGRAHAKFNLVDTHIEDLLQLGLLGADFFTGFLEFDHDVLVVIAEHIEVVSQNVRGLHQRVFRGDASIRPHSRTSLS